MAFQVKATVIGYDGDEEKYPCHFQHKVGDEFIWDGERFIGRICPYVAGMAITKMLNLAMAGPRHPDPLYYAPFWYAPVSRRDPSRKKYDGLGFRNVLEAVTEPPEHRARLQPKGANTWPPPKERTVAKDDIIICPDTRTSVMLKLEVFDLCDKGDSIPYFRRQMSILNKVRAKPGIPADRILGEFSKDEIEIPYPALSPILVQALNEELALMGYLQFRNGKAYVTPSGRRRLQSFRRGLSKKEKAALNM